MAAWMACIAVLMASLAPSVSHSLAAAGLSSFTASALWLPAEGTSSPRHMEPMPRDASHGDETHAPEVQTAEPGLQGSHSRGSHSTEEHFENCPFCFTHAGSFCLLPNTEFPAPAVVSKSDLVASLFYQSPDPLFIWTTAQSRAPPSDS
jgi:hypothetical protein